MIRLGMILFCSLPVMATSAAAEALIEPGQWNVTSNTVMNGAASPPQAKAGHAQGSTTERYLHAHRTSYPDAAELAEARVFGAQTPA